MSREETIALRRRFGNAAPVSKANPYSIANLARAQVVEAAPLEDSAGWSPPEEVVCHDPLDRGGPPKSPRWWRIGFVQGNPRSAHGEMLDPVQPGPARHDLAGSHAFGRWTSSEKPGGGQSRSREIYETPACCCLNSRSPGTRKPHLAPMCSLQAPDASRSWAESGVSGLWFRPLQAPSMASSMPPRPTVKRHGADPAAARAMHRDRQEFSFGQPLSCHQWHLLAANDRFDHRASEGFIYIWGLRGPALGPQPLRR